MKNLTLSLLCAGLFITTTAIAEDICDGAYQVQNYPQAAECYINKLKKEYTFNNLERAGISYLQLGRYKEALPYLKEAETKARTASEYKDAYNSLSVLYSNIGDNAQDFAYSMKFLDLSLKSGNRATTGTAYSNLGEYYRKQKEFKKALEYYQKALEYKEDSERAVTYGNMATTYNELNDYQKAEEMYKKSVEIDEKVGDYNALTKHKVQFGIFYFMRKQYIEAKKMLQDGLILSQKTKQINSEAHALSILGVIDYREGNVNAANEKVTEGLRLAKLSGEKGGTLSDAKIAWDMVNGK